MSEPLVIERLRAHDNAWKGPGHKCRCPGSGHANGDRHPSLSVDLGNDGRVLLRCFAGCAVDEIVRALGCEKSDLFTRKSATSSPRMDRAVVNETRYEVRDVDGTVLAVHVRVDYSDGSKIYRWADPFGNWHSGTLEVDRLPLFATERVRDFPSDSVRYVCEGEKSANALLDVGTLALGTVGGASKCPSADALAVLHGTDVVLWPDNDAPGRKHMAAIAAALQGKAKSIRFVRWDEAPPKGDAADFVAKWKGAGLDDVAIRQRVASMIVDPPSTTLETPGLILTTLDKIEPEAMRWIWTTRIALGNVTLIAGDPGLGKSMLTHEIAARVTMGERIADDPIDTPVHGEVLLFTAEDSLSKTVRPRIDAARGDVSKVHVIHPKPDGGRAPSWLTLDEHLGQLEEALAVRPNVRLMIFDPLNAYIGKIDAHKDHALRPVLGRLGALAERYDVAVVVVAHLNKGESPAKYRVGGSIGLPAFARVAWLVALDPENEVRRLLLPLKTNLDIPPDGIAWSIFRDAAKRPFIIWSVGPLKETADTVLSQQRPRMERPKRTDAAEFIRSRLSAGAVESKALETAAIDAGFSRNTYFRARDEVGAISVKRGPKWFTDFADRAEESKSPNGECEGAGDLPFDPQCAAVQQRGAEAGDNARVNASRSGANG